MRTLARICALAVALWLGDLTVSHAETQKVGDPELIALTESEYTSLPDFSERLAQLAQVLTERNDSRAVFAAMYVVLTENGIESIDSGYFEDGEWVSAFMVVFGNYYRQAFFDYECGQLGRVPAPWRVTFDAAAANEITAFQHGLLGVHTHINRDMAYAVADVTPPCERARRFADFVRTNDFIVASVDEVEDAAVAFDSGLGVLDARLGALDEKVLKQVLSRWRFRAWREAATVDLWRERPAGPFVAALRDRITGRQAELFRDSDALVALGSAGGVLALRGVPQHGKRLAGGHAQPVLVEMRDGRVLQIDLD